MEKLEEKMRRLFGKSTMHLKLLLLFYKNREYAATLSELSERFRVSILTVREAVDDLIRAGILKREGVRGEKVYREVVMLNKDSPCTRAVFRFLKEIERMKWRDDAYVP